jgi:hypothetical protein
MMPNPREEAQSRAALTSKPWDLTSLCLSFFLYHSFIVTLKET